MDGPIIKIFFRYLFIRLFIPFAVCIAACTMIWVMVDLYGNIDDFLEHKTALLTVLRFYSLQIPSMLVQVLPAALLFSTLWTLLALNRRSELIAFQSGGMAPVWLFSPFFVFAFIWVVILAFDMNWPAAKSEVTRDRLLAQVKGQNAKSNVFVNLPYIDKVNRRVWFFQSLDINQNKAKGVEILQRDAAGREIVQYFAQSASWTGEFWRLHGVNKVTYGLGGGTQDQRLYQELDLPEITTPPQIISLNATASETSQMTVRQLSEFISTSASSENLAKYRTEWWYRVIYPITLLVLMFFALIQATNTDRRSALTGVAIVILVLILYVGVLNVFLAAGRFNRLPPFIAVVATPFIFGSVGIYLLGMKNGWGWQLLAHFKRWKAQWEAAGSDEAP